MTMQSVECRVKNKAPSPKPKVHPPSPRFRLHCVSTRRNGATRGPKSGEHRQLGAGPSVTRRYSLRFTWQGLKICATTKRRSPGLFTKRLSYSHDRDCPFKPAGRDWESCTKVTIIPLIPLPEFDRWSARDRGLGSRKWSGRRESNPRVKLGRLPFYH